MLVAADAFVLATHGEGWCRPLMEGTRQGAPSATFAASSLRLTTCCRPLLLLAMAMEVPVIATNWSGPTQFITVSPGFTGPEH